MGARQKSIEIKGHGHKSATPMACRVGPVLATSGVNGKNVKTGEISKDPDQQTKHAFVNMAAVMKEGGMDMGDIVKMSIIITDDRKALEEGLSRQGEEPGAEHRRWSVEQRRAHPPRGLGGFQGPEVT